MAHSKPPFQNVSGWTEVGWESPHSGYSTDRPRFEPYMPQIYVYSSLPLYYTI
jgi:hypothetical protein